MTSDINTKVLLFRRMPPLFHPYIKIARLDRPTGIWLLLLPGWWAIVLAGDGLFHLTPHHFLLLFLFALGAVLMRSAGCIVNDLWDQKLDIAVARTRDRPLASGEMTQKQALSFLGGLLALSFLILLFLPPLAVILGASSLLLVATYPLMKKITWWPQLFLGFTFSWGALLGWAATGDAFSAAPFLLYVGGVFWTLAYDTIYAHQDIQDDALIGIKSTARLFGDKSRVYVIGFYAFSLFLISAAKWVALPSILTPLLTMPPLLYIIRRLTAWDPKDPASSGRIFASSHIYGWLILLLLAI